MRALVIAGYVMAIGLGYLQPSHAALFSISGVSDESVPADNDLIPTANAAFQALVPGGGVIDDADGSGLFWSGGAQLSTTADNVAITYYYIGSFAGATNTFSTPGGFFASAGMDEDAGGDSTPQANIATVQTLAGLVDFGFSTDFGGGAAVDNKQGNNPVGGGDINYLLSYLVPVDNGANWEITDTPTNAVLMLLDDTGRGSDSDYDDLGVVAIASIPVPAALPLFAAALAGLGVVGWRRKSGT